MIPELDQILFGGSFDPPHRGHFSMARYVLENGIAGVLYFVPAAVSPFKMDDPPAPADARMEMLRIGAEIYVGKEYSNRVRIFDYEVQRPPPSYTADTCEYVRKQNPGKNIGFLIGSDSFHSFHRWRQVGDILQHHPLVVFMRPGDEREHMLQLAEELKNTYNCALPTILNNPPVDCASSELKTTIYSDPGDEEILRCVPPEILEYIKKNNLYGFGR